MIVVEFLDGFGCEVVEVLVGAFGVEPEHPFGGGDLDAVVALVGYDLIHGVERGADGGL